LPYPHLIIYRRPDRTEPGYALRKKDLPGCHEGPDQPRSFAKGDKPIATSAMKFRKKPFYPVTLFRVSGASLNNALSESQIAELLHRYIFVIFRCGRQLNGIILYDITQASTS
jgi:hypothetical protein